MSKKSNRKKTTDLLSLLQNYTGEAEDFDKLNDFLQRFCQDNILALKSLTTEVEDTRAIEERILYFALISRILNSLSSLEDGDEAEIEIEEPEEKKENRSVRKEKKGCRKKSCRKEKK